MRTRAVYPWSIRWRGTPARGRRAAAAAPAAPTPQPRTLRRPPPPPLSAASAQDTHPTIRCANGHHDCKRFQCTLSPGKREGKEGEGLRACSMICWFWRSSSWSGAEPSGKCLPHKHPSVLRHDAKPQDLCKPRRWLQLTRSPDGACARARGESQGARGRATVGGVRGRGAGAP